MSDFGFRFTPRPVALGSELPRSQGFRQDDRFGATVWRTVSPGFAAHGQANADTIDRESESDPVADAWSQGFEAGFHQANAEAEARRESDRAAVDKLRLALSRLDSRMEEELRLRLRDTVAALCEAAIAPLALDRDALASRVERAAAMLSRADDERVLRLHPEDIALLADSVKGEWKVEPDPGLERGTVRVQAASGGVEDGPAMWREVIREALHQC